MAYYSQWSKTRPVRRLTWACGSEHVLIADVIREHRAACGEQVVMVASEDSDRDIWAACSQPPADPDATRLVVVRGAQRLRAWTELDSLIAARDLSCVRVLWHSEETSLAQSRTDDGTELVSHLAALRDYRNGQIVLCNSPDMTSELPDWVVAWASSVLGGAGPVLGQHLLSVSGEDLDEAANIAAKLRASGIPATRDSITAMAEAPADFAESVLAGRRREALAAAELLSRDAIGSAIGLLSSRLDTLGSLHKAVIGKLDARETAVSLGVGQYLQRRYRKMSASYGPARVSACRSLLAMADDAWRSGVTEGVPEAIAVLWGT